MTQLFWGQRVVLPEVTISTAQTAAIVDGPLSSSVPARRIGSSDLRVFPLALSGKIFGSETDAGSAAAILDSYTGHGGNFIDTADSYADGESERIIGDWMRGRKNRDDLVVATKIGKSRENPGLRGRAIRQAVAASLRRLDVDHIDLLYLHIDDTDVDFEETLLAVDEQIRAGRVRYFGGSDHTGNRLIEARVAAGQIGVAPMVALQNQYNLMERDEYEGGLAHVARQQNLGVMPRFALAAGFLAGGYRTRADLRGRRGRGASKHLTRRGQKVLASLDAVAAQHEVSVSTIALAWLLTKPFVVAPVASASRADQVIDLTAAASVSLTRQQITELDRVSAT